MWIHPVWSPEAGSNLSNWLGQFGLFVYIWQVRDFSQFGPFLSLVIKKLCIKFYKIWVELCRFWAIGRFFHKTSVNEIRLQILSGLTLCMFRIFTYIDHVWKLPPLYEFCPVYLFIIQTFASSSIAYIKGTKYPAGKSSEAALPWSKATM
jgi:hypothetical protein